MDNEESPTYARQGKLTERVLLRVSPTLHRELESIAAEEGRSVSGQVRIMLYRAVLARKRRRSG